MNEKDRNAFFGGVVIALSNDTLVMFRHFPQTACFDGTCDQVGVSHMTPFLGGCNWRDIRNLVFQFFETGPEVFYDWKLDAKDAGFDADELHELMVGVFISGAATTIVYASGSGNWTPITHKTLDVEIPEKR